MSKINRESANASQRKYMRTHPWVKTHKNIRNRCTNRSHKTYYHYGERGITSTLTIKDLEYIWNRDNAWDLKHASIDRIDPDKNYTVDNCRYIELSENCRRGGRNK